MLVSNSFDLWQRDAFFSAAEEVQESTDILESAYRTWVRQKKEGISSSDLDELRREVQTALGTAKWQDYNGVYQIVKLQMMFDAKGRLERTSLLSLTRLEEFEKAVNLSYGNCRDQMKMARHQQFVVAIESQISRVENTLRETLHEEGKQPFRWVNLDEDERDDLAMFLSGSSGTFSKNSSNKVSNTSSDEENLKKKDLDYAGCSSSCSMASNAHTKGSTTLRDDIVINIGQPNSLLECSAMEVVGTRGDMNCETERTRGAKRTNVSTNSGSLKIVIPDEDTHIRTIEATPKEKGYKASSLFQFRGMNCINKLYKFSGGANSKMQSSRRIQFNSSMRLVLILMVSFFLLVPYLFHSS